MYIHQGRSQRERARHQVCILSFLELNFFTLIDKSKDKCVDANVKTGSFLHNRFIIWHQYTFIEYSKSRLHIGLESFVLTSVAFAVRAEDKDYNHKNQNWHFRHIAHVMISKSYCLEGFGHIWKLIALTKIDRVSCFSVDSVLTWLMLEKPATLGIFSIYTWNEGNALTSTAHCGIEQYGAASRALRSYKTETHTHTFPISFP